MAGLAADLGQGVHIHVAEDRVDSAAGERLEALATDDWLLAHCVHLDRPLRGTVAHNPRSNMNNAVGYARPARLGNTVVLGTDGIGGDMLEEFRIAYVRHREDDVTATPDDSLVLAGERQRPRPGGRRGPGPVELRADRPVASRLHAGCATGRGRVAGEVVFRDGRPTRVDPIEVRARAHEQALRLWARPLGGWCELRDCC